VTVRPGDVDEAASIALVRAFEACDPELGALTHAEHLRVAWHYLRHEPLGLAAERMDAGLRRFAASRGAPDRYHATITWAYVVLLAECRRELGNVPFDVVAERHPALLDHANGTVRRLYGPGQLDSALAREVFLLPRRSPMLCAAP
jgi:N-formylglutamate deformylase